MKILVTGATGRLGRYVIDSLLEKGHSIKALLISPEDTAHLADHKHLEIVCGDITDSETLIGVAEEADAVIHLAAVIDYTAPESTLYKVNTEGTRNLLKECSESSVKKFIYISSTAVYGKDLPKELIKEDHPLKPNNAYGKSKMLAEEEVLKYKSKMNVVILRLSMLYGPGFDKGYFFILKSIEKGDIKIIGNGKNRVPLLHVRDAVKAIGLSLENETKSGSIYNVSAVEPITQEELLEMAAEELGVQLTKKHMPVLLVKFFAGLELIASYLTMSEPKLLNEYVEKISSDRQFDMYRIEMDLGFIPEISIKEGIKEMVEYYIEKEYGEKEEEKKEKEEMIEKELSELEVS